MCLVSAPKAPPAPAPIPEPVVSKETTMQTAPNAAKQETASSYSAGASSVERKRVGRGSLRIPLGSLSQSGLNFPTA